MVQPDNLISRRDFLKMSAVAFAGLMLPKEFSHAGETLKKMGEELLPVQQKTGVLVAQNMPVMLYPLKKDYFYDHWKNKKQAIPATVEEYKVSNIELGYLNLFSKTDTQKRTVTRYTILPHTTGQRLLPIATFDEGTLDNKGLYHPTTKYYSSDIEYKPSGAETGCEHTILSEFYPNKIINILEAFRAIDDFQQENGGFIKGQEYSMLTILNLQERKGYVVGLNSGRRQVTGGGVCVVATNMCKLQRLLGSDVTQRWMHYTDTRYNSSPFAGWVLRAENSDATVERGSDGQQFDFRWVATKNGYICLSATVMPNGKKVINDLGDDPNNGGNTSDASILATMRYVSNNPGSHAASLENAKQQYIAYRKQGKASLGVASSGNRFIREIPWTKDDRLSKELKTIAPEERVSRFESDFSKDQFLGGLVELRSIINSFDVASGLGVGTYIRQSEWYKKQVERLKNDKTGLNGFESALNHLDQNTHQVTGQPVQCIGLAILLAGLNDKDCKFKNIGGEQISRAAQLVPDSIKNGSMKAVSRGNYSVKTLESITDYQPGDLFLLYNTPVGHIGGVVGKKVVNGETVLLFAAANQTSEGDMKLFEVDGNNFDVVTGPPSYKRVVIR